MSSKSRCGYTQKEREDFLKSLGFALDHTAKGSHSVWVHEGLRQFSASSGKIIDCPPNMLDNVQQKCWEISLSNDPAFGKWQALAKRAQWVSDLFQNLTSGSYNPAAEQRRLREEFRDAFSGFTAWKKEVRNWLKAGLPLKDAPRQTVSYDMVERYKRQLGML